MSKTRKVMEINDGGVHLTVVKHCGEVNPFRLYRVWWDCGWHRKEIERYADLKSIACHVHQIIFAEWSERESDKEGAKT